LAAARALSKLVFGGARYRIEVGAAIVESGGTANVAWLAEELRINRQSVHQELSLLERAGLLERLPRVDDERKVYFRTHESPFWDFCVRARGEAAAMLERKPRF
jgi:predicted transcriptional regulator